MRAFLNLGPQAVLTLDASPWGLGGVLQINGKLVAYFVSRITTTDARVLGCRIGSSKSQQAFELLCVLVALRAWQSHWLEERALVHVRSDNFAALVGASRLKGRQGLILRELSYLYSSACFEPAMVEHLPGVANVTADKLSRIFEPGADEAIPALLADVPATRIPPRGKSFWKTLAAEQSGRE